MHHANNAPRARATATVPATRLRAAGAALLVTLAACGGGGDTPLATPTPTARPASMALSLESGTAGNPVSLSVSSSANGDGFVAWVADDGTRHNVRVVRYDAATGTWSDPVDIEQSDNDVRPNVFVNADALGNAMVAWYDSTLQRGRYAWFDHAALAWAAPADGGGGRGLGDASGTVLVGGSAFDPARGDWQPTGDVIKTLDVGTGHFGDGGSTGMDGAGNALAIFPYSSGGWNALYNNYFDASTGRWDDLPPDATSGDIIGGVPGSFEFDSFIEGSRVVGTAPGRFLAAWKLRLGGTDDVDIKVAAYDGPTRTWTQATKTVVPAIPSPHGHDLNMGSGGGNTFVLWLQDTDTRTSLRALRLDDDGLGCGDAWILDSAVAGGAAHAEVAVDPGGQAVAVWQQFEGGRADDGSRSNIAFSQYDGSDWQPAVLAETEPGNAISPRASAGGGQALLGWIQDEGGVNRVKVLVQPLASPPAP